MKQSRRAIGALCRGVALDHLDVHLSKHQPVVQLNDLHQRASAKRISKARSRHSTRCRTPSVHHLVGLVSLLPSLTRGKHQDAGFLQRHKIRHPSTGKEEEAALQYEQRVVQCLLLQSVSSDIQRIHTSSQWLHPTLSLPSRHTSSLYKQSPSLRGRDSWASTAFLVTSYRQLRSKRWRHCARASRPTCGRRPVVSPTVNAPPGHPLLVSSHSLRVRIQHVRHGLLVWFISGSGGSYEHVARVVQNPRVTTCGLEWVQYQVCESTQRAPSGIKSQGPRPIARSSSRWHTSFSRMRQTPNDRRAASRTARTGATTRTEQLRQRLHDDNILRTPSSASDQVRVSGFSPVRLDSWHRFRPLSHAYAPVCPSDSPPIARGPAVRVPSLSLSLSICFCCYWLFDCVDVTRRVCGYTIALPRWD